MGAAGAAERPILARLAVFNGDFDVAAAAAVSEASLAVLTSLVERSLLRASSAGHFQLHELLRQFAAEQLASDPETVATRAQYRRYYLVLLAEQEPHLLGGEQQAATARVGQEAQHVRSAWLGAVEYDELELIDGALLACFSYFSTRSLFQEGKELFAAAAAATSHRRAGDTTGARRPRFADEERAQVRYALAASGCKAWFGRAAHQRGAPQAQVAPW